MIRQIESKNELVLSLRDYLKGLYNAGKHCYTFGLGDFEAACKNGAYLFTKRKTPKDITGFCFRKDLCTMLEYKDDEVIKNIADFMKSKLYIQSNLEKNTLTLQIGCKKYSINVFIDKGYAGEISIHFLPEIKLGEKNAGKN